MASTKTEIPLAVGKETAAALIESLKDVCERIEVVGSVRRGEPIVHDVELLLEPKAATHVIDLFGTTETMSLFEDRYKALVDGGYFTPVIGGFRLKRFVFREMSCEFFVCIPPSQWGLAQVIRSGPASFSHRLVTPRTQGGLCPIGLYVKDLCVHRGDNTVIPTPTEESVFELWGLSWIEPEERS